MRKITAVVMFTSMVLVGVAHALTLEVTSGTLTVGEDSAWEPSVHVSGDGWSLQGFSGMSWIEQDQPTSSFGFNASSVTLGGVAFRSECCNNNSIMTIGHPIWDPVPPLEVDLFQPFSSPFTMTGTVGSFDPQNGVTITGQGVLNVTRVPLAPDNSSLLFVYTFTPTAVPEPPTLLLVVGALGVLIGGGFLRGRHHKA